MSNFSNKSQVTFVTIDDEFAGQRVDNFLINRLKGMPRTRVYRLLRKGEVRVNKKRIQALYKLSLGDIVRIPPVFLEEKAVLAPPSKQTERLLLDRILYENDELIILNKPSGISVHLGSTVRQGIIEVMRHAFPKLPHLELAHRLDTETSGCLILAKKKRVLRELHSLLREGQIKKYYLALTMGIWRPKELDVQLSLHKDYQAGGKHVVTVRKAGKEAHTLFKTIEQFGFASLMQAKLYSGRTHQIRVHAQAMHHSLAGDDRYGDVNFNKKMRSMGLKRLFLHAKSIDFILPSSGQRIKVEAPLDKELEDCLAACKKASTE